MDGSWQMAQSGGRFQGLFVRAVAVVSLGLVGLATGTRAQTPPPAKSQSSTVTAATRPKLVVLLVVDQMRGDYVDKFRGQWSGGLKRLVDEGAWFERAAYPYAATETCVGHSTISTGALPASHGMVANGWWDRDAQKMVTCTSDPKVKNIGYGGAEVKGGDSDWRMEVPSFAEELKFQTGGTTRVVSLSLKARAAITMAGHKGDAVTWFDSSGALTTSDAYGTAPFVEEFAKAHPVKADFGKTWTLSLPENAYLYEAKAFGAVPPKGWDLSFPHALRGKPEATAPDEVFYEQWGTSPFADTYLTKLAESSVESLGLGKGAGMDFLAVSYSSVDYVGHAFGPRSREIQDILVRLDKDLGELFAELDRKVGRGKYVVAFSADHGVVPIPEDMERTGADAGVLHLPELQARIEKALEALGYSKAIARITGSDIYFTPGIAERIEQDPAAQKAIADAALAQPGVAAVYRARELRDRPATQSEVREAMANSYFAGRSGDYFVVPKPYWLMDGTPAGKTRDSGTGHGTPYNYDQHVPILLMGFGIEHGEYFRDVTPVDIAPTLAALCGITLATRDGHVLAEGLHKSIGRQIEGR